MIQLLPKTAYRQAFGNLLAEDSFRASKPIKGSEVYSFVGGGLHQAPNPDEPAELVSTATGVEMSGDDLMKIGERIYNVEKAFNVREGVGRVEEETPRGPTGMSESREGKAQTSCLLRPS